MWSHPTKTKNKKKVNQKNPTNEKQVPTHWVKKIVCPKFFFPNLLKIPGLAFKPKKDEDL
jgi:hypothetical protein